MLKQSIRESNLFRDSLTAQARVTILMALQVTRGNVAKACRMIGMPRQAFYNTWKRRCGFTENDFSSAERGEPVGSQEIEKLKNRLNWVVTTEDLKLLSFYNKIDPTIIGKS